MLILKSLLMNRMQTQKGFSLPEVIVAIALIVIVIVTATNLLITSMRANRENVNKIIAYNLAQEALEGFRNIRDGYWIHNQFWRGSDDKNLFGESFIEDGSYIVKKQHNLKTTNDCFVLGEDSNTAFEVRSAVPWKLEPFSMELSKIYIKDGDFIEYVHESTDKYSGFDRWIEVKTIPYDLAKNENEENLKISVTAVVKYKDRSRERELRIPTVLTDWKAGPL